MMQLIADNAGAIVVFALSALLALATELWFPTENRAQRRFWAFILFILSFVLGLSVNGAFQMNRRITEIDGRIEQLAELGREELRVHKVASDYGQIIEHASNTLRKWGADSENALDHDLAEGYIPIGVDIAAMTIGNAYNDATRLILASNVGSIDFYFDVPQYAEENRTARDHHVPVIRFFIYSKTSNRIIKLTRACYDRGLKADSITDFTKCVSDLNEKLGSLCSIVVDFDKQYTRLGGEAKDLMLMDNSFVATTELYSENWAQKRAKATEAAVSPTVVAGVRAYFNALYGVTGDTCTARMEDEDVRRYFPQLKFAARGNEHLADAVFRHVMQEVLEPQ
jgi:hypothetical protein